MLVELSIPERTETEKKLQSEPELKASAQSGIHPFAFTYLLLHQQLQVRESSSSVLARVSLARTWNNQDDATVLLNNGVLQHSSLAALCILLLMRCLSSEGPTRPSEVPHFSLFHNKL